MDLKDKWCVMLQISLNNVLVLLKLLKNKCNKKMQTNDKTYVNDFWKQNLAIQQKWTYLYKNKLTDFLQMSVF